MVVQIMNFKLG